MTGDNYNLNRTGKIFHAGWSLLLALALIFHAHRVCNEFAAVLEFPFGCDSFGYLVMARDIRQTVHGSGEAPFRFQNDQSRFLIRKFKKALIPLRRWNAIVGPHAHYYFPRANAVGVQYPPGTGFLLSIFPEGSALYGLNITVLVAITGGGLLFLFFSVLNSRPIGTGVGALATLFGQEMLRRILSASYSINAILFTITVLFLLLSVFRLARLKQKEIPALLLIFASGLFCGFSVLIRISYVFALPGLAVLVLVLGNCFPDGARDESVSIHDGGIRPIRLVGRFLFDRFLLAFALGILLVGFIPQAIQQHLVSGAWYLPTYSNHDVTLPIVSPIAKNFRFYFLSDQTAITWKLLPWLLPPFLYLSYLLPGSTDRSKRFFVILPVGIIVIVWGVPLLYFLSHSVRIAYYLIPFNYTLALVIALFVFLAEGDVGHSDLFKDQSRKAPVRRVGMRILIVFVILLPGLPVLREGKRSLAASPLGIDVPREIRFQLPPRLQNRKNWIWADLSTGTIWYYFRRPAFRITPTDIETRALLYRFAAEYGGKQYFIEDAVWMGSLLREIRQLGGRVIPQGEFGQAPFRFRYYRIEWPNRR